MEQMLQLKVPNLRLIIAVLLLQQFCCTLISQSIQVNAASRQSYSETESSELAYGGRSQYDRNRWQEIPQQRAHNRQQQQSQQSQTYNNRLSPSTATATHYELNEGRTREEGNQQLLQRQQRLRQKNRAHESMVERSRHKCRVWVPTETVEKYPLASAIQTDQSHQQSLIEICCSGFVAVQWLGAVHCRPVCENCSNGYCRAPDECICYQEFVKNDNGDCVFTCPLGCLNGRCYLDGSCECELGYKLDESRKYCRPICSTSCDTNPRHNCTEPEFCTCAKGYTLTDEGCQPVCNPDCGIGGVCRENNECDCGPGYTLKSGVCQSDCYQKCDNGVCVSRNRCICNAGFSYHERSTQCVPV